ncbi:MAG: pyridoxamine 5'-phosphate oxidase [Cytophagales bacterium]|nr:pyridoxamine 5'-phosphate oxidase [Cytophagales bacterium]
MNTLDRDLTTIRKEYMMKNLDEATVLPDPVAQFNVWLDEAIASDVPEPTAMNLATVGTNGRPSSRIVLLKGVVSGGFVFFTNYNSPKGIHLATNIFGSLNFFWPQLERQVRIEGRVTKLSARENDEYFDSRPEGSKIGAWASPQSKKIKDRSFLEKKVKEVEARFMDKPISRPPYWGGYRLNPIFMEFWQGRPSRLHDRIHYEKFADQWRIERLAP